MDYLSQSGGFTTQKIFVRTLFLSNSSSATIHWFRNSVYNIVFCRALHTLVWDPSDSGSIPIFPETIRAATCCPSHSSRDGKLADSCPIAPYSSYKCEPKGNHQIIPKRNRSCAVRRIGGVRSLYWEYQAISVIIPDSCICAVPYRA